MTSGNTDRKRGFVTKEAVEALTVGLAQAVSPGLVDTGLHAAAGLPDRLARMAPTVPMARAGQPVEVAEAVVWLLSGAASYITGAVLAVSGGR